MDRRTFLKEIGSLGVGSVASLGLLSGDKTVRAAQKPDKIGKKTKIIDGKLDRKHLEEREL